MSSECRMNRSPVRVSVLLVWEDFFISSCGSFCCPPSPSAPAGGSDETNNFSLPMSVGKRRHRRLDYRLAQPNGTVKDAKRGEADSLTGTGGCATRRTARNPPMNPSTLPSGIPEIAVIYLIAQGLYHALFSGRFLRHCPEI